MKKLLLLTLTFFSGFSFAQVSFNGPQVFGPVAGGELYPIFQGSGGEFSFHQQTVPQITGIVQSIDIDIEFTNSVGSNYASDLTFIISENENVMDSSNNILQLGGYDQLASSWLAWNCTGCSSSATPISMLVHLDFPTPIDFTDTNFIMWMGNGYLNTNASGTWKINSIQFGGTNDFVGVNESTFDVRIYPNPTNEVLSFQSKELIQKVEVFSLTGQHLSTLEINGIQGSISVAELNNGTYICRLSTANGLSSLIRFVKN